MNAGSPTVRRGLVVGTAGHVDHGKTTLVTALTGVETDRWREERERGLTIDIGFAPIDLAPDIETGVVDVPGHEDFLKNMLAGATGIDLLLLVVAADEGPMPQTREHLAIARLLNVHEGVVALTKRDRVDEEWLELAEEATRDLLADHDLGSWPVVPVSSTTGAGLDVLRERLADAARGMRSRSGADLFRMPVDRAFSIHGTGTVVTGTVWSGSVETGDTVRILPSGGTARVRSLQVHGDARGGVEAGRRCALALVGVDAETSGRGSALVTHPEWQPANRIGVAVDVLAGPGRPLEHSQRIRVYVGTREVMARVATPDGHPISPGSQGWAVLTLEDPLVVRARDRGVLRFYSPVTTVGGFRVAEIDPPRDWTSRVDAWASVLDGTAEEAFEAAVALSGARGFSGRTAAIHLGIPPAEVEAAGEEGGALELTGRWFSLEARDETAEAVMKTVGRLHGADRRSSGVSLESVRSALAADRAPELVQRCIDDHQSGGTLEAAGPLVSLPGATASLTDEETRQLDGLRGALRRDGLQPATVNDLGRDLKIPRDVLDDLLRLLVDEGAVRAVTPEIYVDADALSQMIERVRDMLRDGEPAGPAVFKDAFGLSRKYLIPLLEYLDRSGVTRRVAEGRTLV